MLPPPGMGGPAAQGISTGGAPTGATVPATASMSGGGSGGPGGSASAAATPTVVPASVVTPAARAAGSERPPSEDVLAATRLAWELARASDLRRYPLDWAVGVFRSTSGSETVVMSNEGSGYVPEGMYLPRDVRVLVADPLVGKDFRDYWFGWQDPARVLVAYAGLRADSGWKLVAAASTWSVDALREAHIECGWADRERSPLRLDWSPPSLDELHVHRLELEYPDLYGRLQRLATIQDPRSQDRLMWPLTATLVQSAFQSSAEVPLVLRGVWNTLKASVEPPPSMWEEFGRELSTYSVLKVGVKRAGFECASPEEEPGDRRSYRDYWLVARAMEMVAGWEQRPLRLADMAYAAGAVGSGSIRAELEPTLREIEEELRE
jgi:hypothetical protein